MNATSQIPRLTYSIREATQVTGLSPSTLRRMAEAETVRSVRVGKLYLIPVAELERICASGANADTEPKASA